MTTLNVAQTPMPGLLHTLRHHRTVRRLIALLSVLAFMTVILHGHGGLATGTSSEGHEVVHGHDHPSAFDHPSQDAGKGAETWSSHWLNWGSHAAEHHHAAWALLSLGLMIPMLSATRPLTTICRDLSDSALRRIDRPPRL